MKTLIYQLYYVDDSYGVEIIPASLRDELREALTFFDVALDLQRVFNKAAALFASICRGGEPMLPLTPKSQTLTHSYSKRSAPP